jgi:short-subunit dehydrogenase
MQTALITGASCGIGEAFAHYLAQHQTNLILVARSEDKLLACAQQLTRQHSIRTEVIAQDLAIPGSTRALKRAVDALAMPVDLLINNAGFGDFGPFTDSNLAHQTAMVQLNVLAVMELTHLFLPAMVARANGGIINVSSIAGFQPMPYWSVYAATKAFVLSFTEALWAENRHSGVKFLALCPGPTESEFFNRASLPDTQTNNMQHLETVDNVVKAAMQAYEAGQSTVVTGGLSNHVIVNLNRFLPRKTLVGIVEKQFRPSSMHK